MYCNNCGKQIQENSKFCKHCGSEIIKVSEDKKNDSENTDDSDKNETTAKKVNTGLGGWLAFVGLGLIASVGFQAYNAFQYLPLITGDYNVSGLQSTLQIEFVASVIATAVSVFLLVLYFKKNKNFPKFYIYFLIGYLAYALIDYFLVSSLHSSSPEVQNAFTDSLTQAESNMGRTIVTSIIWILYMTSSKQVKTTFVNE